MSTKIENKMQRKHARLSGHDNPTAQILSQNQNHSSNEQSQKQKTGTTIPPNRYESQNQNHSSNEQSQKQSGHDKPNPQPKIPTAFEVPIRLAPAAIKSSATERSRIPPLALIKSEGLKDLNKRTSSNTAP